MNKFIFIIVILFLNIFLITGISAQCFPGDSISCPDLNNNGQICPDTLPDATTFQQYSEVVTILPPPEILLDTASGVYLPLHHITLKNVLNLPDGITWVSNTEDSVFMVGNYYCILLEGNPQAAGSYPLKIIVDLYIPGILGSDPIYLATITDSTSLFLNVNYMGVNEPKNSAISKVKEKPNPFSEILEVTFYATEPENITFKLFEIHGSLIHSQYIKAAPGENHIRFDGEAIKPGIYFYTIGNGYKQITKRVIKTNP